MGTTGQYYRESGRRLCQLKLAGEVNTLPRRYLQQIGGSPNNIVFQRVHLAIGAHDFPHHFNDVAPAFIVHILVKLTRAMVEVDRDAINLDSLINQLSNFKIAERKAGL
jgi:hypothetical protein